MIFTRLTTVSLIVALLSETLPAAGYMIRPEIPVLSQAVFQSQAFALRPVEELTRLPLGGPRAWLAQTLRRFDERLTDWEVNGPSFLQRYPWFRWVILFFPGVVAMVDIDPPFPTPVTGPKWRSSQKNLEIRKANVLNLLGHGFTSTEIAHALGVSKVTIGEYVLRLWREFETKNKAQLEVNNDRRLFYLIRYAHTSGFLQDPRINHPTLLIKILEGVATLSDLEMQVFEWLMSGHTYKEMAMRKNGNERSAGNFRVYANSIKKKLLKHFKNRADRGGYQLTSQMAAVLVDLYSPDPQISIHQLIILFRIGYGYTNEQIAALKDRQAPLSMEFITGCISHIWEVYMVTNHIEPLMEDDHKRTLLVRYAHTSGLLPDPRIAYPVLMNGILEGIATFSNPERQIFEWLMNNISIAAMAVQKHGSIEFEPSIRELMDRMKLKLLVPFANRPADLQGYQLTLELAVILVDLYGPKPLFPHGGGQTSGSQVLHAA